MKKGSLLKLRMAFMVTFIVGMFITESPSKAPHILIDAFALILSFGLQQILARFIIFDDAPEPIFQVSGKDSVFAFGSKWNGIKNSDKEFEFLKSLHTQRIFRKFLAYSMGLFLMVIYSKGISRSLDSYHLMHSGMLTLFAGAVSLNHYCLCLFINITTVLFYITSNHSEFSWASIPYVFCLAFLFFSFKTYNWEVIQQSPLIKVFGSARRHLFAIFKSVLVFFFIWSVSSLLVPDKNINLRYLIKNLLSRLTQPSAQLQLTTSTKRNLALKKLADLFDLTRKNNFTPKTLKDFEQALKDSQVAQEQPASNRDRDGALQNLANLYQDAKQKNFTPETVSQLEEAIKSLKPYERTSENQRSTRPPEPIPEIKQSAIETQNQISKSRVEFLTKLIVFLMVFGAAIFVISFILKIFRGLNKANESTSDAENFRQYLLRRYKKLSRKRMKPEEEIRAFYLLFLEATQLTEYPREDYMPTEIFSKNLEPVLPELGKEVTFMTKLFNNIRYGGLKVAVDEFQQFRNYQRFVFKILVFNQV